MNENVLNVNKLANYLGYSQEFATKLIEKKAIPSFEIEGQYHIAIKDAMAYKKEMKARQKRLLIQMMHDDEADRLYD